MADYRVFLEQPALPQYQTPLVHALRQRLGPRLHVAFAESHQGTRSDPVNVQAAAAGEGGLRCMAVADLPRSMTWFRSGFRSEVRRGDVAVLTGSPRIVSNLAWLLQPGVGTVWWGQGWGPNTTARSARARLMLANRCTVRLFYDETEAPLIGHWSRKPTLYINNTIAYSAAEGLRLRPLAAPRFCFIGRLTDKTRPERLVRIATLLKPRFGSALRLGIIGDGPARPALERAVQAAGLQAHFEFHGALFDRDQVSRVVRDYGFLLYPGAIGLTVQHALSEGLPIITYGDLSRHGPESRLLRQHHNAWLCDDHDEAFAAACTEAAELAPEAYQALQQRCLQIRSTHSIDAMADRFVQACEQAHRALAA